MREGLHIGIRTGVVTHSKLIELNNPELMEVANLNTLPFYKELHAELARRNLLLQATELVRRSQYVR